MEKKWAVGVRLGFELDKEMKYSKSGMMQAEDLSSGLS
jgi:hypothetical protein